MKKDINKELDDVITPLLKSYRRRKIYNIPLPTEKLQELLNLMWGYKAYDETDIKFIELSSIDGYCKNFPAYRRGEDVERFFEALDKNDKKMIKYYRYRLEENL